MHRTGSPLPSLALTLPSRLALALGVALGAAGLASGCDCSGDVQSVGPCQSASPPTGCGAECGAARPCRAGLYCGPAGTCTADCAAGEACSGGVCSSDGHCVPGDAGPPRDAAPRDAPAPDNTCASVSVGATRTTPNVILVIDRSGSMDRDFEGSTSRWDTLENALLAMPSGPIFSLQSSVRFGVAMYTDESGIAGCPDLVTIPAALGNYTAIDTRYRMEGPGGQTPTGDSIQAILGMLDTLAPVRDDPTILVLATDGEPDTCEDGNDEVNGRLESIAAVEAAFSMGVRTFVVSVGTDVGMTHLQDVANAGLGHAAGDPPAEFWVATDTTGLVTALEEIIGGVVSCQVTLEGRIDPAEACSGTVRLGTDELECGTDWRAIDETRIELLGAACDRLQTSSDELTATFPCGVVIF